MTPVPLPLSVKLSPAGSDPVSVSVGTGEPLVLTVKVYVVPTVAMLVAALLIAGAWLTVSTNDCVAKPPGVLAVMLIVNTPPLVGVPLMVAVPLPLFVNVVPPGRVPERDSVAVVAVVVTWKLKAEPTFAVADAGLVNDGAAVEVAALTVRVNV
jgi:hypothetical protein